MSLAILAQSSEKSTAVTKRESGRNTPSDNVSSLINSKFVLGIGRPRRLVIQTAGPNAFKEALSEKIVRINSGTPVVTILKTGIARAFFISLQ